MFKKKDRIKSRKNSSEFSKLTGVESFIMEGGSDCIITSSSHLSGFISETPRYAYYYYNDKKPLSWTCIKVSTTCGVKNCVKKEHLVPFYIPDENDKDHIDNYLEEIGIFKMAQALKVPIDLFRNYIENRYEKTI